MARQADCHPDKPVQSRGLCAMCYMRLRRNGSIEVRRRMPKVPRQPKPKLPMLRDPDGPCCDVCASDNVKLVRFSLIVGTTTPDGRHTARGAGAIVLCGKCWAQCKRNARTTLRPPRPTELRQRAEAAA